MTEWERIKRKRNKYLKKYYVLFRKSLNNTIQPVIDEIRTTGNLDVNIDALIKKDEIEKTFIDLYKEVGVAFYKDFKVSKGTQDELLWAENMEGWCLGKVSHRIVTITEYQKKVSRKIVNDVISRGLEEGMTNQQIVDNMMKELPKQYKRKTMWMARRIVDTETLSASNMSVNEAAKQTGIDLQKEWLTAPPGTARTERHVNMGVNHQTVGINEKFQIGYDLLEFPGDPSGRAENTINCHCAIVHKRAEGI